MNPIENWYVKVLEVMQQENVRTFSHFKILVFWIDLLASCFHVKQLKRYVVFRELISFGPKQHLSALILVVTYSIII